MFYDSTYLLVLLGAVISCIASANVNSKFSKYSSYGNRHNYRSQDVADMILRACGINDVRIERIRGNLTDHYSPGEKVLRLSDSVYNSTSIAAIGIAAHECGHAIQHKQGYFPLKLRSLSVPIANIGSRLSWPIIIIGIILGSAGLSQLGVFLFLFVVLFQLITLPVEFNASNRAMKILSENGILYGEELTGAGRVLKAAALTYVAALFTAVLQLLRLFLITRRRR